MKTARLICLLSIVLLTRVTAFAQLDSTMPVSLPILDSLNTPSTQVYTLQQCVDSALQKNVTVKAAEFLKEGARITRDQQIGNALPSLQAYAQFQNSGGRSVNVSTNTYISENYNQGYGQVTSSLTLWNGFSLHNFIRQYALAYQADNMDYQAARDVVTVNTILAYLQVLSNQEQLTQAEKNATASGRKVAIMEIQNREGSIAPIDLSDAKGQLAQDELTAINIKNSLEVSKNALCVIMNVPYSPSLGFAPLATDLTPVVYNASVDDIFQNASRNLATVKASRLHLASAQKGVKAAWGNMMPTLALYGGVSSNYSTTTTTEFQTQVNNNLYTQVGVSLNIPILQSLHLRNLYRQSRINLDQAQFNASTTVTQLKQSIESYYITMMSAFRTYNGLLNEEENYQESYRGAEIKYEAGALPSLNFIIYKTNLDNARLNLIQAKYNYILQTKILDYYQGTLKW